MKRSALTVMAVATLVCAFGCGDPPVDSKVADKPVTATQDGGKSAGTQAMGLNPNYPGSAAGDDAKVGSKMKGK